MEFLDKDPKDLTIKDIKGFLQKNSMTYSFRTRSIYVEKFLLLQKVHHFPWREDQKTVLDGFLATSNRYYVINGIFGCGKCHGEGTEILMFDGTLKKVEDIKVGDKIMGDDSTPRNVLALGRGRDDIYSVTNHKGVSYTVNSEHILCLKYSMKKRLFDGGLGKSPRQSYFVTWFDNKNLRKCSKAFNYRGKDKKEIRLQAQKFMDEIDERLSVEIEVSDYVKLPKHLQVSLKGYSTYVEFPEKKVEIDPYILGIWLGDGTSSTVEITTQDSTVIKYLKEYLPEINCYLQHKDRYTYRVNGVSKNRFLNTLRKYCLLGNKHIPQVFKCNSRENRLRLLAGLIDSDGSATGNMYEFSQKNERLMDDVIYLCRSLGFACYKTERRTDYDTTQISKRFRSFRIHISGEGLNEIPCLVPRKQVTGRKQIKDAMISKIKVKKEYYGDYYGFTIDGNNRYVLGNFVVTHNTTLLLGIVLNSIIRGIYSPDEILFLSFNVCIRNELRSRLRGFLLKSKVTVRTFDSIIYEICKNNNYEHIDLPNFDGKRRFVYTLAEQRIAVSQSVTFQPKVIFIDEVQDLEKATLLVFKHFYPTARIVFAGDVFQSIQKEPRESLLWDLMNSPHEDIYRFCMRETPRVPQRTLRVLQATLTEYYPEFSTEISEWRSSNPLEEPSLEWHRFYSYKQMFSLSKEHIEEYGAKNLMILTFSSAITVRGAMGDLSRLRNSLSMDSIVTNKNYKSMDPNTLFLSTVNSSKGLERDYVVIFLTFPLEKAFINFSEDLTMNLITVGLSRAKRKVIFYVPAYEDKFSSVLYYFKGCPKPNKESIRDGKAVTEFSWGDFINIEHNVTELLRQSILIYDTRIKLKENVKIFEWDKIFDSPPKVPVLGDSEEVRAFVGILIENLITSTWVQRWPRPIDLSGVSSNPMYSHCMKRIVKSTHEYISYIASNRFSKSVQFQGIYIYTQLHVAIYNKLYMNLPPFLKKALEQYWRQLEPCAMSIKPICGEDQKIHIQHNMKMPWITGVCDTYIDGPFAEIWEIKASTDYDWKDDALTQAVVYALMGGRTHYRIVLINPFRNEISRYYFDSKKIMTLRNLIYKDTITWNFNCYLAKNNKGRRPYFPVSNKIFVCQSPLQYTAIEFLSPTKVFVRENVYIQHPERGPTKQHKIAYESELESYEYVPPPDYKIWTLAMISEAVCMDLVAATNDDFVSMLDYKRNEDRHTPKQHIENNKGRHYELTFDENLAVLYGSIRLLVDKYRLT